MEREPLLGRQRAGLDDDASRPLASLRFYWLCLSTGISLNTLSVCASVWLTKQILDDPSRATYFQTHWWVVWLVWLLLVLGASRARDDAPALACDSNRDCGFAPATRQRPRPLARRAPDAHGRAR